MHISELKDSNYLTKHDVTPDILVTIKGDLVEENLAMEGKPEELKHVLYFEEYEKGIVLNSTNAQLIALIVGSENTEDWDGHRIVLYNDPNVSFAGKLVGGIRVRAPKKGAKAGKPAARPAPPPPDPDEDEIPF